MFGINRTRGKHYHPRVRGEKGRENQMISFTRIFPLGRKKKRSHRDEEIASKTTEREIERERGESWIERRGRINGRKIDGAAGLSVIESVGRMTQERGTGKDD